VILKNILKENIFGKVLAYLYMIEFQKCGLTHAHIFIILAQKQKPQTVTKYDALISAEISDKDSDLLTFDTVQRSMMHRLCGTFMPNALCMKNEKCSKRYPQSF